MNCQICSDPMPDELIGALKFPNISYSLCGWCTERMREHIHLEIHHVSININWGGGRVCFGDWQWLRDFIRTNGITEMLEFGTGLSTELFVNEGLKVTTCDILKNHSKLYSDHQAIGQVAKVIHYEYEHTPEFDRTWDFIFVDGSVERSCEVRAAMKYGTKWIFLHDPGLGEQSFFPNAEWEQINVKLFKKVGA